MGSCSNLRMLHHRPKRLPILVSYPLLQKNHFFQVPLNVHPWNFVTRITITINTQITREGITGYGTLVPLPRKPHVHSPIACEDVNFHRDY